MTGKRAAMLIAIDQFENLPKLSAPVNDAESLRRLLSDQDIGAYDVELIINKDRKEVIERLGEFLKKDRMPDDLLLVYYSGHGITDDQNRLYLTSTDTEENKLDTTAISADIIKDYLGKCRAQSKILILDCCFSGAISSGKALNVGGYFPINFEGESGLFILTASSEIEPAIEIKTDGSGKRSLFTDMMIQGLILGEADLNDDYKITAEEMYSYINERIKKKESLEKIHFQEPMRSILGAKGEIIFAYRPKACSDVALPDPILDARIKALESAIRGIATSDLKWKDYFNFKFEVHENLWAGLDTARNRMAKKEKEEIQKICNRFKGVHPAKINDDLLKLAWSDYLRVYSDTRRIFNEYLEFIGALTFRDIGFQNDISSWADELILDSLKSSFVGVTQPPSPSVLVKPETMIKVVARIIGLHFAEWNLWTLPLAAHELGHVLTEHNKDIGEFLEKLSGFSKSDVYEFFSDAFATYTMGPAYAYASIYLSLNPELDLDIKRANIIFSMLELMNVSAGKNRPYDKPLIQIRTAWSNLIQMYQGAAVPTIDKDLMNITQEIWNEFNKEDIMSLVLPTAKYPANREDEGWEVAVEWKTNYDYEHGKISIKDVPKVHPTNKIRDILNAAWLIRLDDSSDKLSIENVEKFALLLFNELHKEKLNQSRRGTGGRKMGGKKAVDKYASVSKGR